MFYRKGFRCSENLKFYKNIVIKMKLNIGNYIYVYYYKKYSICRDLWYYWVNMEVFCELYYSILIM